MFYMGRMISDIFSPPPGIITLLKKKGKRSQGSGLIEERMSKYFTLGAWVLYSPL
jgi:hypothetical protein